jgi:hypothetical protein
LPFSGSSNQVHITGRLHKSDCLLSFSDPGKKQHFSWVLFAQEKKILKSESYFEQRSNSNISLWAILFWGRGNLKDESFSFILALNFKISKTEFLHLLTSWKQFNTKSSRKEVSSWMSLLQKKSLKLQSRNNQGNV